MAPNTPSGLLGLPVELRLQIYGYLLPSKADIDIFSADGNLYRPARGSHLANKSRQAHWYDSARDGGYPLNLLGACKQIRKEVSDGIYRSSQVTVWFSWVRGRKLLGQNMGQVRHCAILQRSQYLALKLSSETFYEGGRGARHLVFNSLAPIINALTELRDLKTLDVRSIVKVYPWVENSEEMLEKLRNVTRKLERKGVRVTRE